MRVEILNTAENDLEEGFRFYEAQSVGLGAYFLDSLFSDIDSLAFFAGIHQKHSGYYRLLGVGITALGEFLVGVGRLTDLRWCLRLRAVLEWAGEAFRHV